MKVRDGGTVGERLALPPHSKKSSDFCVEFFFLIFLLCTCSIASKLLELKSMFLQFLIVTNWAAVGQMVEQVALQSDDRVLDLQLYSSMC